MNRPTLILLPLLAACASSGEESQRPLAGRLVNKTEASTARSAAAFIPSQPPLTSPDQAEAAPVEPQDPQPAAAAGEQGLSVFRSPAFRRRLAMSYLSDLETEPQMTEEEREIMQEVLNLIADDKAADAADILLRNNSEGATAMYDFVLGTIYYQQDSLERAGAAYQAAIEKHPKFRRAWSNLGQIHFKLEEHREAVRAFSQEIELGGGNGLTYGLLGVCHIKNGAPVAAESAFRLAMMLEPQRQDWKMGLADAFFRQGRFASAVTLFGTLLDGNPSESKLWMAQGDAYARMGELLKAAENYEMVDRLGGATSESLATLGDIYAKQELWGMSVDAYLRALRKDGGIKVDRVVATAKYMVSRNAGEVVGELLAGIEEVKGVQLSTEQRKEVLKLNASLALARGASDEEAKILQEVVDLDPTDGHALILLGQHAARNNQIEKAIFYFERAEGIEASEPDALVRHAEMLVRQGKKSYPTAIMKLQRAQSLKPRSYVQKFLDQVQSALNRR